MPLFAVGTASPQSKCTRHSRRGASYYYAAPATRIWIECRGQQSTAGLSLRKPFALPGRCRGSVQLTDVTFQSYAGYIARAIIASQEGRAPVKVVKYKLSTSIERHISGNSSADSEQQKKKELNPRIGEQNHRDVALPHAVLVNKHGII